MRTSDNRVASVLDLYRVELAPTHGEGEALAIARAVFSDRLGLDRAALELGRDTALSESELLRVYLPLKRLRTGEPLHYVLGHVPFMGLIISVAPGVLIPRPETEELVDLIVRNGRRPSRITDIGTGSGCIALALKSVFPLAEVTAVDISDAALVIARGNAKRNGLDVHFRSADVLDPTFALDEGTDLVVSNPPYVPRSEEASLTAQVRDHEPHLALFVDDADPLLFYRSIAEKAFASLLPGGSLWFEGHFVHSPAVGELLRTMGFADVEVIKDMSGNHRFIHGVR